MGASTPIVEGFAHIETEKLDGVPSYRWSCSCRRVLDRDVRRGSWLRNLSSTLEAFRQHWENVHSDREPPDWSHAHQQALWLLSLRDDDGRFWVAPSGKRPAVAEDYYAAKKDSFAQLYDAKATVRITNLTTGAISTVTGASVSFDATLAEEKKGMSRLSDIQARMRELEKEAARYARFPKTDEWPIGTVITYNWTPGVHDVTAGAEVYTYAVLKAGNGDWYWTGAQRNGKYTGMRGNYDVLVENLADENVSDIRVATPEDFDPLFPELTDLMSEEDAAEVEDFLANPETGVKVERRREGGTFVPVVKGSEK